ncbi:hypothetical protein [Mycetocola spongiae]|uniref:hypothetical protein n=1 Tax=Mycetocola spongiae TaxID=2859226 RepID=UPI001CF1D4CE|nr:hypothetical protein [Mycetocola spongiae]UCR87959.1 hypothetical protein KXZ72_08005 [Mycetocola spongiae]
MSSPWESRRAKRERGPEPEPTYILMPSLEEVEARRGRDPRAQTLRAGSANIAPITPREQQAQRERAIAQERERRREMESESYAATHPAPARPTPPPAAPRPPARPAAAASPASRGRSFIGPLVALGVLVLGGLGGLISSSGENTPEYSYQGTEYTTGYDSADLFAYHEGPEPVPVGEYALLDLYDTEFEVAVDGPAQPLIAEDIRPAPEGTRWMIIPLSVHNPGTGEGSPATDLSFTYYTAEGEPFAEQYLGPLESAGLDRPNIYDVEWLESGQSAGAYLVLALPLDADLAAGSLIVVADLTLETSAALGLTLLP